MCGNYPTGDNVGDMFVHTRCKHYLQFNDVELIVVSIRAQNDYRYESIEVSTLKTFLYKHKDETFDILMLHAPLYTRDKEFINEHKEFFKKIVFVFHGYEAVNESKVYPKPYEYQRASLIKRMWRKLRTSSERKKLRGLRRLCSYVGKKLYFVFVSNSLKKEFIKWTKIKPSENESQIISNGVGNEFEIKSFNKKTKKEYDFLTIRSDFSSSVYCADILTKLAKEYPQYKFFLIGNGDYFMHNKKPDNLDVEYKKLTHHEIINYCDRAKCALMLTRRDTQGVMACEIATFGMPLITSDISVTREIFDSFQNVQYVTNDTSEINLENIYNIALNTPVPNKNDKYFMKNTSYKEIELFREITK